jgi:RimJ/RimL family protein N-acetyltransferase
MGDPEMTRYLGGPESADKIADRQQRYLKIADAGTGRMFAIVIGPSGRGVGSVGYWDKEWQGLSVYEIGWSVIPAFQGGGIASRATAAAIERARSDRKHRFMLAYPGVDNAASNAICRKLGFTFLGAEDFEYPPGHRMRCNDWRLDLRAG